MKTFRIKDVFHKGINKDKESWVYSNNPCFNNSKEEFMNWVEQHTDDTSLIEEVSEWDTPVYPREDYYSEFMNEYEPDLELNEGNKQIFKGLVEMFKSHGENNV
jgi:hypothetical protein